MITASLEGRCYVIQMEPGDLVESYKAPRPETNRRLHADRVLLNAAGGSRNFWLGGNVKAVEHIMRYGWPEGVEKIQRLADEMRNKVHEPLSFKRRQRWAEDGDEPSWEREQHGHTEIWRTAQRKSQRGPVTVELLAPWGGVADITAEELQWNGVVLAVLCDVLENAGYRVGAYLNNPSRFSFVHSGLIQIEVKQPNMPLDLASLVPVVAHPGSFRVYGISAKSLAPFDIDGWGQTVEIRHIPQVPQITRPGAIVMNHCYDETAAREEIERVLALFTPQTQES